MIRRLLYVMAAAVLTACGAPAADRPLPTLLVIDTLTPPTATPQMRTLEFWTPGEGQISAPDGADVWTFTGQMGDNISLRAVGQGVTLALTLFDPAGNVLREGETILTQLPQTGIFGVRVRALNGAGTYAIGLGYSDRDNPNAAQPTLIPQVVGIPTPLPVTANLGRFITEISDGQTVGEQVDNADRQHVYVVRGAAGQYLNAALTRVSGMLYPRLTLYSPEGVPLATDAESAGESSALLRNVRLPEDGFYSVQTIINEGTGAYSLRLDLEAQPVALNPTPVIAPTQTPFAPDLRPTPEFVGNGAPLSDHRPVLAQLDREGAVMIHTFEAQAGDIVTLSLKPEPDSALIPRMEVINPEGVPIITQTGFQSPQNRAVLLSGYVIEAAGVYSVFVTGEGATWGDYTLGFGYGSTARTRMQGEAPVDRPVDGELRDVTTRDAWYMHLKRGDVITVSVTPRDDAADTVLEVVDANGALLGIDNRSGSTRQPAISGLTIPGDGLYYVRVRAAGPEGVGAYTLNWRYLDVAPTPEMPRGVLPLLRLTDTVADSAYAFYPFYGQSGQRIRIRVVADDGLAFDPVAALLDPSAQVIAEGDDANGTLNPEFTAVLPADGTYNVRVNGYLTGGRFTLLVEALY